jgi:hypothetical protein
VIEPPDLTAGAVGLELEVAALEPFPEGGEVELLLHAAAVSTIAAAPARQAVRIDISRNLTGIHLLVIDRTLVGDKG